MKKRLISLVLMLAMAISTVAVFSGCGDTGNIETESTIKPMTITIAMITEEETTPAGIQIVQDALNRITEKELNTHVVLQLYTAEEYDAAIEAKIKARQEYRATNDTDLNSFGKDEDKVLNEYGREVTAYPEPYENQIDIFLLNGVNNLEKYTQYPQYGMDLEALEAEFNATNTNPDAEFDPAAYCESMIATLDSYLADNASATLLNKYISAGLMNNCRVGEELKAIPSNGFYGNSEYLLINKELFDKYKYNIENVTDIVSLQGFLTDIATNEQGITPLYNYGSLGLISVTGKNSAVTAYVPNDADPAANNAWVPAALTEVPKFKEAIASINTYASINGQYPVTGTDISGAEDGKFAAAFVSTDAVGITAYEEDYYTVLVHKSMVTTNQVYDNAFAVFEYTSDQSRCMEIIKLIQTDRDFHNILLYGVENVTYTVDEDTGLVSRKHEGTDGAVYSMDINLCGNLFISKPNDEMSALELVTAENDWAKAKEASRNISYSPYMGFELEVALGVGDDYVPGSSNNRQPSTQTIDQLESLYYQVFDEIAKYPDAVDETTGEKLTFDQYFSNLNAWLRAADNYLVLTQINTGDEDLTIKKQYINWWTDRYVTE